MRTPAIKATLEYLYSLQSSGIKPGLRRVETLLEALGNPQKKFPSIHIAGTNGKGSTAAMLEAALIRAGFRTGLYTSPHLARFNERIRVSGRPVSDRVVAGAAFAVREALRSLKGEEACPSFFEFTTAMAFLVFMERKVDIAVVETGMGGRWDATNTVTPVVSIITNIGKEHTEYLGRTLAEIASEKAGIIKPGTPVVTAEEKPVALKAIRAAARKARSPLYTLNRDFSVAAGKGAIAYKGMGKPVSGLRGLRLGLRGPFQAKNAACALAAIEIIEGAGFHLPQRAVRGGLKKPDWPGRVEVLSRRPLVLLDSAHNPAGAASLAGALKEFRFKRLILVAGVMADKDIRGIFKPLAPLAETIILCAPKTGRAAAPALLAGKLKGFKGDVIAEESVARACDAALAEAGAGDAVCVAGSIFTVEEARAHLSGRLKKTGNR